MDVLLLVLNVQKNAFKPVQHFVTINAFFHIFSQKKANKDKMRRNWKPALCEWERENSLKSIQGYKLVSYNILAQDLLVEHLNLYYGICSKILKWETRLKILKEEISFIQPDILCLQEMQYDHLKELVKQFSSVANNAMFEYIFKKKTGKRSDGCVIIYDRKKFKVASEECVEYYTDGISTLNRENIGLLVEFQQVQDNSKTFIVATTHLLYNPKREDVRISQVNKLIQAVIEFSGKSFLTRGSFAPVILTGDFNFTRESRGFKILTSMRSVKVDSGENNQIDKSNQTFFQMDAIDFGSIYAASTYQDQWITVDYILISNSQSNNDSIRVNSVYKLPSVEQCLRNGKIPNKIAGSDHFSLAIHFSIC